MSSRGGRRSELMWPAACLLGPSRLALVLHGAPLIQGPQHRHHPSHHLKSNKPTKSQPATQTVAAPASSPPPTPDSGPLPRIIKPRKRRKKERKQPTAPPRDEEPPSSPTVVSPASSPPIQNQEVPPALSCTCSYCDPSNDTWDFTPPTSWDVSSEIVTSANGHRDLEIKFILPPKVEPVKRTVCPLPPPWSAREE